MHNLGHGVVPIGYDGTIANEFPRSCECSRPVAQGHDRLPVGSDGPYTIEDVLASAAAVSQVVRLPDLVIRTRSGAWSSPRWTGWRQKRGSVPRQSRRPGLGDLKVRVRGGPAFASLVLHDRPARVRLGRLQTESDVWAARYRLEDGARGSVSSICIRTGYRCPNSSLCNYGLGQCRMPRACEE